MSSSVLADGQEPGPLARPHALSRQARRADQVLFQIVGSEAVLLDLATEQYFGLDPIGTHVWQLLAEPCLLRTLCDTLIDAYDAPAERIEADLLVLVDQLASAGLIKID